MKARALKSNPLVKGHLQPRGLAFSLQASAAATPTPPSKADVFIVACLHLKALYPLTSQKDPKYVLGMRFVCSQVFFGVRCRTSEKFFVWKRFFFQKSPFSRDSREFGDSRDSGEPQTVENKGESDHLLEVPENLGRLLLGHQGPTCRDIPDPGPGMSRTKTLCKVPFAVVFDREWPGCPAIWAGTPRDQENFIQQFTYGVVSEGVFAESLRKFCGKFAEICKEVRFIAPGKGAEILRKVCGNFAEICGKFSAMTPSRTTP